MHMTQNVLTSDRKSVFQSRISNSSFQVEFVNEKDEQCRIDFSTMRETIGSISRRVHRTTEDSTLPPVSSQTYPSFYSHHSPSDMDKFQ